MKTLLLSILAAFALTGAAAAQSTAFTYQGRLKSGGNPATGLHDFRFTLFDAPAGGLQQGDTQCANNVAVADGLFTTPIDFGQQFAVPSFEQRFLEIEVRTDTGLGCGNANGFTKLSPRQPLTAAPMASHAQSAFSLDAADGAPLAAVLVDNLGRVGIGTDDPQVLLHVNGTLQWGGALSDYGYSGEDAFGLFLEQDGTTPGKSKIRLQTSKSGDANNYSQFFIDPFAGFSFMTLGTGSGNVGIGTQSPTAKLDVRGEIRMGVNGQVRAAGGQESLRLLRGSIDGNGSIDAGGGFTSQREFEGAYKITFDTPFSAVPSVTATAQWDLNNMRHPQITQVTTGFFRVDLMFPGNSHTDSDFSFCVIGPQ